MCVLVIFAAALVIRLGFLGVTVWQHDDEGLRKQSGDSWSYLLIAERWLEGSGVFASRDAPPNEQLNDLVRTPGYPALVAGVFGFVRLLGGSDLAQVLTLLTVQALLDSLVAAGVAWGSIRLWRRAIAGWIAGGMVAVGETGLGMSAAVLADTTYAAAFAGGTALTVLATQRRSGRLAILAGAAWGVSALVKPTSLPIILGLPILWWLASSGLPRRKRRGWVKRGGLATAVALLPILGWSAAHQVRHDLFTLSIIGDRNLRYMVGPAVTLRADLRDTGEAVPTGVGWRKAVERPYWQARRADIEQLEEAGSPAAFVDRRRREIRKHLLAEPGLVAVVLADHFAKNLVAQWDGFALQGDDDKWWNRAGTHPPGQVVTLARWGYWPSQAIERTPWLRLLIWIGAGVVAAWALFRWLVARGRTDRAAIRRRRAAGVVLMLGCTAGVVLLTSSTTVRVGSRTVYPAFLVAALLLPGLAGRCRRKSTPPMPAEAA